MRLVRLNFTGGKKNPGERREDEEGVKLTFFC